MNLQDTGTLKARQTRGGDVSEQRQTGRGIRGIGLVLIGLMMAIAVGNPAVAGEGVMVVATFDAASQELPEGLTIDKRGNIYVTMGFPFWWGPGDGQIRKIAPDGTETELAYFEGGQGPAGIVVNARGDVYYARPNPLDPATNGIYRLYDDGSSERLLGSAGIVGSNGLAFDKQGDLFVSDSLLGAIWHIPVDGSGPAEVWSYDPLLLGGCGDVGANGVALWKDNVYVANTLRGLLVSIPILEDGSAGVPELIVGDNSNECDFDELFGLDGIALDVHGIVYALSVIQNKLIRIDPDDGTYETLLTEEDGLFNPASIAFGTGRGDRKSVFISNYALFDFAEPAASLGPAVLKFDVGAPGLPLPQD